MRITQKDAYRKHYEPEIIPYGDEALCFGVKACDICKNCVHYQPGSRTPAHFLQVPMGDKNHCRCYKGRDYNQR